MVERYRNQSALAHLGLEARAAADPDAGVVLGECRPRGRLVLRGDSGNPKFGLAVVAALGFDLVVEPLTAVCRNGVTMLWLGPDEWLVVTADHRLEPIERVLREALDGQHAALSDVSHSYTTIMLAGRDARAVLSKGCSLDLHPRAFAPGRCARSHLAKCNVLIHQVNMTPGFEIYVHRSFAQYAWMWLEDSGAEFGVRIAPAE